MVSIGLTLSQKSQTFQVSQWIAIIFIYIYNTHTWIGWRWDSSCHQFSSSGGFFAHHFWWFGSMRGIYRKCMPPNLAICVSWTFETKVRPKVPFFDILWSNNTLQAHHLRGNSSFAPFLFDRLRQRIWLSGLITAVQLGATFEKGDLHWARGALWSNRADSRRKVPSLLIGVVLYHLTVPKS